MEKIRVKKEHEYVIEVNDEGDTISFNPEDPELMLRFDNALQKIKKFQNELKIKQQILSKKQDEETDTYLTKNQREEALLWRETFTKMREAMDEFLGKGACQKIFGDSNYISMFDDLLEQLEPHFKKLNLNAERMKTEITKKYANKDEEEL